MSAGYQEIFLEQGSSFHTTITLDDIYGEAYDLSNYSGSCQMKKSYYSSNVTASFVTTVGSQGQISLALDAPTTANIYPGRYLYDVIIYSNTDAANNTLRVLEGIINVTPSVTKV